MRIPSESVEFDFDNARASMDVDQLEIEDYFTLGNALQDGKSVPATVSFHVRWHGVNKRSQVLDKTNHFRAQGIEDNATIRWSAHEKGFKFVSDPADTSTTVFAEIRHERNGVFF